MTNYHEAISSYITTLQSTLDKLDQGAINEALNLLVQALNNDKTIYIFGNGGSASTASHFQNDFNKGISEYTQKKFRFQCLSDNVATVLAIANDISFEEIFRFQLQGRLMADDLVIAISGSGNSRNVLNAVDFAKQQGNTVIGLTGFEGGQLKQICDVCLHVPINSMQVTEDVHLIFDHLMMAVLNEALAGRKHLNG